MWSSLAIMVTAAAVAALVFAERARSLRGVMIAKPIASLGFIAVGLAGGALDSGYGTTLLVGLCACAIGDALLIVPGAGRLFLAGMVSFALGHAAYGLAFAERGVDRGAGLLTLLPMIAVAVATLRWLSPRLAPAMQQPIRFYIAVISVMVALAVGASVAHGSPLMALGAIAFAASDLAVARERFVRPSFTNQLWGLPLYYAAQVLLALSV